jgi:hypothetical protein
MSNIHWHDDQLVYGIRTRAFFFDPVVVDKLPVIQRLLPFFSRARPELLMTETDVGNKNVIYGELIAQPDAIFSHGNGLIALEYKSHSGRSHDRNNWTRQIRLASMLQAVIASIAVAGARSLPGAVVLRCHNVVYLLDPSAEVLQLLTSNVSAAKKYWQEGRRVNASQLAAYCEPLIKRKFGPSDDSGSAAGRERHEKILAR